MIMTYQDLIDSLNEAVGTEVKDWNGTVWTVNSYDTQRYWDPLVYLWNRETYQTKYVSHKEFSSFVRFTK